jgi:Secretion system C-terminal sorting domain
MLKKYYFYFILFFVSPITIVAQRATSNSPVCEGVNLQLSAEGGTKYAWKGPNSFSSDQQNPTISKANLATSGIYSVTITNDTKTSLLTVDVRITKLPIIGLSSGITGTGLYVAVNSGSDSFSKVSWKGPNGFTSTETYNLIKDVTPKNFGTYTMEAIGLTGCVNTATTTFTTTNPCFYNFSIDGLEVYDSNLKTASGNICGGGTKNIFIYDVPTDGVYTWLKDGKNLGINESRLTVTDAGIYECTVETKGCSYKYNAIVKKTNSFDIDIYNFYVQGLGIANSFISPFQLCKNGGEIELTASAGNISINEYQWFKDGQPLTNVLRNKIKIKEVGNYTVRAVASDGCVALSQPAIVEAKEKLSMKFEHPFLSTKGDSISFCNNLPWGSLTTPQTSEGFMGSQTQWYKNGIAIKDQVFQYLDLTNLTDGNFQLKMKQGTCDYQSPIITLSLNKKISTKLKIKIDSVYDCQQELYTYYLTLPTTRNYEQYEWYRNGVKITLRKGYAAPYLPDWGSGRFYFRYTEPNGCYYESEEINITSIKSKKTVNPPAPKFSYSNPKNPSAYCIGTSGRLNSGFLFTRPYAWFKDGVQVGTSTIGAFEITESGTYTYSLTDCGNRQSDPIKVVILSVPKPIISRQGCDNSTITLATKDNPNLKYQWIRNGILLKEETNFYTKATISETYSVIVTDTNKCFAESDKFTFSKETLTLPSETFACKGSSLFLGQEKPIKGIYSWTGPNNFTATSANVTLAKVNSKQAGVYTAILTNADGCKFSATTKVIVQDPPSLILPKTLLGCENAPVQLFAKSKLTDSTEVFTKLGISGPKKFNGQYFLDIDKLTPAQEGYYVFTAYLGSCEAKDSVNVKIDKSGDCKAIVLEKLAAYEGICSSTTVEIPFKTIGNFAAGTKYTVYAKYAETGDVVNLGTFTQSPAKVKFDYPYAYLGFTYYIKASDNTQSINSPQVKTKDGTPYAQIYGNSVACKESNLSLSYYSGYTLSNFQWTLDGKDIDGEKNDNIFAKKSGRYDVRFDFEGCTYKSYPSYEENQLQSGYEVMIQGKNVKIGEIEKPRIYNTESISPLSFCSGSSFILSGSLKIPLDSSLSINYLWKRNGEVINLNSLRNLSATKAGDYTLEITNGTCTAKSDPFTVIATDNVKANVSFRTNLNYNYNKGYQICKGTPAYLHYAGYEYKNTEVLRQQEVTDLAKKGIIIQWYKNGILLPNAKNPVIKITEEGNYTLRVQDGECLRYSDNFSISFKIQTSRIYYNYLQACDAGSIYLSNSFGAYSSFYNEDNKRIDLITRVIEWRKDGKVYQKDSVTDNNYYSQYIYPTESGSFSKIGKFIYQDGSSCSYVSDTVQVKIGGSDIALTSYFSSLISCSDSTQLYYGYSGSNRIISNIWKKDGVVLKNQENTSLYVKESGKYTLETNFKGGCKATGKPIDVKMGQFTVNLPTEINICENQKTEIYANVNNNQNYYDGHRFPEDSPDRYDYQWQKDGIDILNEKNYSLLNISQPGSYSVKTKFKNCQAVSNNTVVSINKIPNAISPQDSARFCPKTTIELKVSADKGLAYEWYKNKIILPTEKTNSLKVGEAGTYRVLLNRNECYGYTKPVVAYEKLVLPTAKLSDSLQISYGDSVKVKVNLTGDAPWTFKISDGREFTASTSPYTLGFRPLTTSYFTVQEVKNICGIGTVSGKVKIEVIILATEEENDMIVNVFPSPTNSVCQIEINTLKSERLSIMLTDMSGKILIERSAKSPQTNHKEQLDLSNYPTGNYILNMKLGEKIINRKIIKTSE